jgi:TetR/AcrR family transcriptional regulator, mexCD-oprJ operon repressor
MRDAREAHRERPGLAGRVTAAILESAAELVATHGDAASMADVAASAGVSRATVYRHFPNRQALLDELRRIALADVDARLRAARIGEVAPLEAIVRAVRALTESGHYATLLVGGRTGPELEGFGREIGAQLSSAFARAQDAGRIRRDLPAPWLAEALIGLVGSGFRASPAMGREDMVATITSVLLEGALETSARDAR